MSRCGARGIKIVVKQKEVVGKAPYERLRPFAALVVLVCACIVRSGISTPISTYGCTHPGVQFVLCPSVRCVELVGTLIVIIRRNTTHFHHVIVAKILCKVPQRV